jgi:2,3-bisphosphoglycerate-dependent phosphoglycerate mutase
MWERSTADPHFVPRGDSARQARAGLAAFLGEVAATVPPSASAEIVVAVTRGGLITDFLASTFSEDLLDQWHPAFLVHQSQLVAECSLTLVACAEAGYTLKTFATASHLRADTRYP